MPDAFEAHRYIRYLWARRGWIALSAAIAVGLSTVASMLMTREYTAAVRIVIEPPAGTDLRAAMAVSPIYLESLRTYEQFAASDRLFANAVDRFRLRAFYPRLPLESLKQRVLKAQISRNTRILEISTTLPDPVQAQHLAEFLAESTVALNRSTVTEGDRDLVMGFESQAREVRSQLEHLDAQWARLTVAEPTYALRAGLDADDSLRRELERQRMAAERGPAARDVASTISGPAASLEQIRRQLDEINRRSAEREHLLAERQARRDRLSAERQATQTALTGIEARLREARGDQGYRGERLRVIDSGVVPEKPSSPNVPLNIAVALFAGLLLPIATFTLELQFRREGPVAERAPVPLLRASPR